MCKKHLLIFCRTETNLKVVPPPPQGLKNGHFCLTMPKTELMFFSLDFAKKMKKMLNLALMYNSPSPKMVEFTSPRRINNKNIFYQL